RRAADVAVPDINARVAVAGDDVAVGRRQAADGVVVRAARDIDAGEAGALVQGAGRVGADEIAGDRVAAAAKQQDAAAAKDGIALEVVDHQAAYGAAGPEDGQARGVEGRGIAVDLDPEDGVVADGEAVGRGPGLAVAVDKDGAGDGRQGKRRLDGVDAAA